MYGPHPTDNSKTVHGITNREDISKSSKYTNLFDEGEKKVNKLKKVSISDIY